MIRALLIDGHWRVVDMFGRRYLPDDTACNDSIWGSFIAVNAATPSAWDESTRMDERTALLLAGVLQQLHTAHQERATRILLTCDPCRAKFRKHTQQ